MDKMMAQNLKAIAGESALGVIEAQTAQEVSIKEAGIDEGWVRQYLTENPSLLGLGYTLECRDPQRLKPQAGRVDLLYHDQETDVRYCVTVVLGDATEADLVRLIEYWESERARYYQYRYVPVLVTAFAPTHVYTSAAARSIPLVVVRMTCLKMDSNLVFNFAPIMDYSGPSYFDDADGKWVETSKKYWLEKSSPDAIKALDEWSDFCRKYTEDVRLHYYRGHISLYAEHYADFSWAYLREECNWVGIELALSRADLVAATAELDRAGVTWQLHTNQRLRFNLKPGDVDQNAVLFQQMVKNTLRSAK